MTKYKSEFADELYHLILECRDRKNADSTVKRKLNELLKKFDKLILNDSGSIERLSSQNSRYRKAIDVLKTGSLEYLNGSIDSVSWLSVGDVETVKVDNRYDINGYAITLRMRSGKEISFGKDFSFLELIFNQ